MKVSLFITCLGEVFYPGVGKDVVAILERLGCEVDFPKSQTCCGQPAYNSGYRKEAMKAARQMIKAFEGAEYVVAPSGSCAAIFREYKNWFAEDPEWSEKATRLSDRTYEFTQFLDEVLQVEDVGASFPAKAAYHTSCHMSRLLGVKDAPIKLLRNVEGLELVPFANSYDCCGFGGTFAVKMAEISEQMADEKVRHIEEAGAKLLIGADSGCLMNIKGRMDRLGKPIEVKHIAQVLNHRKTGR